jgi:hypothetical protein
MPNPESPATSKPSSPRLCLCLGAILALALGLRLVGIGFNLDTRVPERALLDQVDERGMVEDVLVALERGDLNPRGFLHRGPGAFVVFLAVDVPVLGVLALGHPNGWDGVLADMRANTSLLQLVHRVVSALFGTATVALLAFALRREFGTSSALWGAALLAVAYQHVRDSHLGRVDVIWAFFSLLTAVRLWALVRRPSLANHLLAGSQVGVAMALKYPGGLLAFALIGAHWVARRAAAEEQRAGPSFPRLLAGLASILLGALLFFPGIVSAWSELITTFRFAWSHFAPEPDAGSRLAALSSHLRYTLGCGLGEPALVLSVIGLVLAWRRGPAGRILALAVAAVAPNILVTSFVAPRLADPLIVLLAGAAGLALSVAWEHRVRWLGIVLALAAFLPPLAHSLAFDWLMLQTDTRVEMLVELKRRGLPAEQVLAFGSPASLPRPMQRGRKPFVSNYQIAFGDSLAFEPKRLPDAEARFAALLQSPPRLILWCESEAMSPATQPFAELLRSRYREVLRLDGRRVPILLPGPVGADLFPFDRPWLMRQPGSALVLHERIDG